MAYCALWDRVRSIEKQHRAGDKCYRAKEPGNDMRGTLAAAYGRALTERAVQLAVIRETRSDASAEADGVRFLAREAALQAHEQADTIEKIANKHGFDISKLVVQGRAAEEPVRTAALTKRGGRLVEYKA